MRRLNLAQLLVQEGERSSFKREGVWAPIELQSSLETPSEKKVNDEMLFEVIKMNMQNMKVAHEVENARCEIDNLKKQIEEIKIVVKEAKRKIISKSIFIQNLRDEHYVLNQPIAVSLEIVDNGVCACCYEFDMFGEGQGEDEAIADLCEVIIDYYESLKEDEAILGPIPKQHWVFLKNVIEER